MSKNFGSVQRIGLTKNDRIRQTINVLRAGADGDDQKRVWSTHKALELLKGCKMPEDKTPRRSGLVAKAEAASEARAAAKARAA